MEKRKSSIRKLEDSVRCAIRGWLLEAIDFLEVSNDGSLSGLVSSNLRLVVNVDVCDLYVNDSPGGTGLPTAEIGTSLWFCSTQAAEVRRNVGQPSDERIWAAGLSAVANSPRVWKFVIESSGELHTSERTEKYVRAVATAVSRLRHDVSSEADLAQLLLSNSDPLWKFVGQSSLLAVALAGEVDSAYGPFAENCLTGRHSDEERIQIAEEGEQLFQYFDRALLGRQLVDSVVAQVRRNNEAEAAKETARRQRIIENAERDKARVIKPLAMKKEFRSPHKER